MGLCKICSKNGWVKIPWANAWFCREHFIQYFNRRVLKTFEKYVPRSCRRILFSISGGKDSISLTHSLVPYLKKNGFEIKALYLDLGINGYSEKALNIVEKFTDNLGIDLIVYRLSDEEGFTIDKVYEKIKERVLFKPICSICGVVKRYLFNKIAFEKNFDLILTGHNLNDMYCFVMSNLVNGSLNELIKLKPYNPAEYSFIARAKPLYFTYEYETEIYCKAIDQIAIGKCPYKPVKEKSLVESFKNQLLVLEEKHPGIGILFLKNIVEKIIPRIEKTVEMNGKKLVKCSVCGFYSSIDPCSFCRLKQKMMLNKK
uniref:Adenine nucleotide alpha hydrolase family protein n=2 Tax=Staphylothermus marinus TaxID=2280 RepID=A0A7C4H919_STAMA